MSSILRMSSAAGIAMTTRMITGTMVQMISTLVLCSMRGVGDRALRMAEFDQRIDHRAEHHDRDADADPEHLHVQAVDVPAHVGDARSAGCSRSRCWAPGAGGRATRRKRPGSGAAARGLEEAARPIGADRRLPWLHSSSRIPSSIFYQCSSGGDSFMPPTNPRKRSAKPASFLLGEEAADLAGPPAALDRQSARIRRVRGLRSLTFVQCRANSCFASPRRERVTRLICESVISTV